jgi:hypothetical protein
MDVIWECHFVLIETVVSAIFVFAEAPMFL